MATIFDSIGSFATGIAKQALATNNLKDFRHAEMLFVGDQYRLAPKNGFLFHVFIDLNGTIQDAQNPNGLQEIGMLAKSTDLPRFSMETKTMNTYNRSTIVQSKVKYDPINLSFHDDSSNVVRNFWVNYYKKYYRDFDYTLTQYGLPYKYTDQKITDFGFTPSGPGPFIRAIRLYSLHKKYFSEYILVNPIIKTFRHGQHDNSQSDSILSHEVTIEYETVLYNSGRVKVDNPKGFAKLHYDTFPSPLTPAGGGTKTVFGPGGILDTGKDVLEDLDKGNYGSALFKAARGLQNAKNMNLKSALKYEVDAALNSAIKESITTRSFVIPNLLTTSGVSNTPFNGINVNSSLVALAGVAMVKGYSPPNPLNPNKIAEVTQATTAANPPTNYYRSLPPNPPVTGAPDQSVVKTVNDQASQNPNSNQQEVNNQKRKQEINNRLNYLSQTLTTVSAETVTANSQLLTATTTYNSLNSKYFQAQALPDSTPGKTELLSQIKQSIDVQQGIIDSSRTLYNTKTQEQANIRSEIQALRIERDTLAL